VDADQRPSHVGPPFTGHFKLICDTPRGLQPWQPAADPVVTEGKPSKDTEAKATATPAAKSDLNLEVGRNIYEASAKVNKLNKSEKTNGETPAPNGVSGDELVKAPTVKVNCYNCGVDCSRVHYHSSQTDPNSKAKYDLCPSCYLEGRLPANQNVTQYTRIENPQYSTILDRDAPWTDSEILKLLEALERFDEDWGEIAEYVGTRTREECVLQFLQLEIEDKYLDAERQDAPIGLQMLGSHGGQLPFNQADNPVMYKLERNPHADDDANGKGKEKEKESGDSMELDVRHEVTTTTVVTTKTTTSTSAALAVPLATLGGRAGGLATHEEREMTRLVSAAVNATLEKLELKLKYFNEMESILQAEKRELERARQQLFLDRLTFKRRVRQVQETFKAAAATGAEQGLRMTQDLAADAERMSFYPPPLAGSVQPLSAEGQIKSYEA
jgi:SWI/SNF related-matrix-associated actin-dependent regulator of chromatin subfamily C